MEGNIKMTLKDIGC